MIHSRHETSHTSPCRDERDIPSCWCLGLLRRRELGVGWCYEGWFWHVVVHTGHASATGYERDVPSRWCFGLRNWCCSWRWWWVISSWSYCLYRILCRSVASWWYGFRTLQFQNPFFMVPSQLRCVCVGRMGFNGVGVVWPAEYWLSWSRLLFWAVVVVVIVIVGRDGIC